MAGSNGMEAFSGRIGAAILSAMNGTRGRQQGESNRENNSPTYEHTRVRTGSITYQNNLEPRDSVVLFDGNNDCVAKGVVATVKVGELLSGQRLHPNEVGILLTTIYKLSYPIVEPFMCTLGECLQCIVRWPQHGARGIQQHLQEAAIEATRTYEFIDDTPMPNIGIGNIRVPTEEAMENGPLPGLGQRSVVGSNDSPFLGLEYETQDGLSIAPPNRTYDDEH